MKKTIAFDSHIELILTVFKVPNGKDTIQAVEHALKSGYRSIDTAAFYGNEEGVRIALEQSGVPRDEVFITTKVWNSEQGYDRTLASFQNSKRLLGVEVIDLFLVHWPVKGKYVDTWRALEKMYADGEARAIGVSNFHVHHLETLKESSQVTPMVNQVELHPYLSQEELLIEGLKTGLRIVHPAFQRQSEFIPLPAHLLRHLLQHHGKLLQDFSGDVTVSGSDPGLDDEAVGALEPEEKGRDPQGRQPHLGVGY